MFLDYILRNDKVFPAVLTQLRARNTKLNNYNQRKIVLHTIDHLAGKLCIYPITGEPGAGKDTKARIITLMGQDSGFSLVTTSQVIDWNIAQQTEIGLRFKQHQASRAKGKMVPDDLILTALAQEIQRQYDAGMKHIFIAGCPRTKVQAHAFVRCRVPVKVFHIAVSEQVALERVRRRSKSEPRADDAVIANRLLIFKHQTLLAISLIRKARSRAFKLIKGDQSIRSQVAHMLRFMDIAPDEVQRLMSRLDVQTHPARRAMDKAECGN